MKISPDMTFVKNKTNVSRGKTRWPRWCVRSISPDSSATEEKAGGVCVRVSVSVLAIRGCGPALQGEKSAALLSLPGVPSVLIPK